MLAENIMTTDLIVAKEDERVSTVFERMRKAKLRMLPVLDSNDRIAGVLSTFCVLQSIVPGYLISGDLSDISYAPDLGLLLRHYEEIDTQSISNVMNTTPLVVAHNESLLSVAASVCAYGRHEYAMVVDDEKRLLGVISAGDILDALSASSEAEHA